MLSLSSNDTLLPGYFFWNLLQASSQYQYLAAWQWQLTFLALTALHWQLKQAAT